MRKKENSHSEVDAGNNIPENPMNENPIENITIESDLDSNLVETLSAEKAHELHDKIAELEKKLAEASDKHLRLFSEFDNYRKRTNKERIELLKTASEDVILGILPVLDDMERAMSLKASDKADGESNGIALIYNKLKTILVQKGLEESGKPGEDFDTDLHEAVTHVPSSESSQKGKVVEILQKGYLLHGKIIRFAKVVVAR